jgi:hypothetical protein|tara:strand:+ start:639 stop:1682 length:1044 start_codon:yes stop_codon:yes gene_type:complete
MSYTNGLDDPTQFFNTILWTGDGNSSRSITGVGFAPDMVWWKGRTTTFDHRLIDTLRSGTYPKLLYPNLNILESEDVNNAESIDSDGFTIGSGNAVNQSGQTYVAWNWKAGGTGSSNTDGSITSTVSANTTAGFSIVSYTGTGSAGTVGHGLSSAPSIIIIKVLTNTANDWVVYHQATGNNQSTFLNANNAVFSNAFINNTTPTSSVFSVDGSNYSSGSSRNYIAYCFAEKKGYSKFGSYRGNGGSQNFIYTGFKPAWIIGKRTDVTNNWYMFDNKRNTFNVTDAKLRADQSSAENVNSGKTIDIISNGVNIRSSDEEFNASGGTYIFMAFAESPFVNSNGVPNNAR